MSPRLGMLTPKGDWIGEGQVNWPLNVDADTTFSIKIRYSLSGPARPMQLLLNNVQLSHVDFPSTGSFSTWHVVTIDVPVPAGNHTLSLKTLGSSGPNIDQVTLISDSSSEVPVDPVLPGELTLYYIHNDHLGTPQVVTNDQQQVVWMADYFPFGQVMPNSSNDVELYSRFPGQYFDEETGLHYNYFRDYDPNIGRYIQSDPIGLAGGINTYAYVSGNPIMLQDFFGLIEYPNDFIGPLPPDGYYTHEMTPTRCGNIPPRPWDASVISNMMDSRNSSDPVWLYNQVRNRGSWDYKQQNRKYEDFGNFNYGAVMSAFGVPNSVAARGAGWANQRAAKNRANLGKWYGSNPYGDDPADQEQIEKGQAFCECMMSSW